MSVQLSWWCPEVITYRSFRYISPIPGWILPIPNDICDLPASWTRRKTARVGYGPTKGDILLTLIPNKYFIALCMIKYLWEYLTTKLNSESKYRVHILVSIGIQVLILWNNKSLLIYKNGIICVIIQSRKKWFTNWTKILNIDSLLQNRTPLLNRN